MKIRMMKKAVVSVVLAFALSAMVFVSTIAAGASYKDWSQSDPGWKYIELGSSGENMGQSGCVVTSTAMLMMHSGAVTDPGFTPGKLVAYFNRVGAFDKNGILDWSYIKSYGVNFAYKESRALSGTKAQKTEQIRKLLDDGYYVMVRVRYGQHFVAVDSVKGDTVYIMDPAESTTNLFGFYAEGGVDSIRVFQTSKSGTSGASAPAIPGLEPPPFPVQTPPAPDPETPPVPVQQVTAPTAPPAPDPETPPAPVQETEPEIPAPPVPDPETPPSPGFVGMSDEPVSEPPAAETAEELLTPPPMPSQEVLLPSQVGISDEMYLYISMNACTEEALTGYLMPDTASQELCTLPAGTELRLMLIAEDRTWGLAEADGRMCWIQLEHVKY